MLGAILVICWTLGGTLISLALSKRGHSLAAWRVCYGTILSLAVFCALAILMVTL